MQGYLLDQNDECVEDIPNCVESLLSVRAPIPGGDDKVGETGKHHKLEGVVDGLPDSLLDLGIILG